MGWRVGNWQVSKMMTSGSVRQQLAGWRPAGQWEGNWQVSDRWNDRGDWWIGDWWFDMSGTGGSMRSRKECQGRSKREEEQRRPEAGAGARCSWEGGLPVLGAAVTWSIPALLGVFPVSLEPALGSSSFLRVLDAALVLINAITAATEPWQLWGESEVAAAPLSPYCVSFHSLNSPWTFCNKNWVFQWVCLACVCTRGSEFTSCLSSALKLGYPRTGFSVAKPVKRTRRKHPFLGCYDGVCVNTHGAL